MTPESELGSSRTSPTRRSGGTPGLARRRTHRPSLRTERQLQRAGFRLVAGMDEVGRGALAGPVSVGVVVIDERCRSAPVGVSDSKLLPPPARRALVDPVRRWALDFAVGHASAAEIDRIGIIAALRLAGIRALRQLRVAPDIVVLDGQHDWLSDPLRMGLFAAPDDEVTVEVSLAQGGSAGNTGAAADVRARVDELTRASSTPPVRTLIKADRSCSSVAAASILAKVERDQMLIDLASEFPCYRWELNKGYAAPEHLAALAAHGPCELHRRSWRLPGCHPELEPGEAGWQVEVTTASHGVGPRMSDDGAVEVVGR